MEMLFLGILIGLIFGALLFFIKKINEKRIIDAQLIELVGNSDVDIIVVMGVQHCDRFKETKVIPIPATHAALAKLRRLPGLVIHECDAFDRRDSLHLSAIALGIQARTALINQEGVEENQVVLPPLGALRLALGTEERRGMRNALMTQMTPNTLAQGDGGIQTRQKSRTLVSF